MDNVDYNSIKAVFPAQAGVIPCEVGRIWKVSGIPRASGGDPFSAAP